MSDSLFDHVNAMLEVSAMIYFIATLSKMRKDEKNGTRLHDPSFSDTLPKTSYEVADWVKKNSHLINPNGLGLSLLDDILKRDDEDKSRDAILEVFDDNFAFAGENSEAVYAITKNPDKKRIAVIFRGSSNERDWIQNLRFKGKEMELNPKAFQEAIPNANLELVREFKEVQIHRGFYEYLFEYRSKEEGGEKTERPKFYEIIGHIMKLVNENPDYELWFSGHSLGGALATLTATCAALSDDIKKPIKLISIASPQVGRSNYVKGMKKLEDAKKLLHLRVTNNNDLVPQLLDAVGYKHFGLHLNLFQKKHTLSFDEGKMSKPWPWQMLKNHNNKTYLKRLAKAKAKLIKQDWDAFDTLKK